MSATLPVLLVSSQPDHRASTADLEAAAAALAGLPGVTVSIWYLRAGDRPAPAGARVVDDLRIWGPAAALDRVGLRAVGDRLRGARLRRWYHQVEPEVVVLDDGLGGRVIPRGSTPVVVRRPNAAPPDHAEQPDARSSSAADLEIGPFLPVADGPDRSAARAAFGLPPGARTIGGWPEVTGEADALLDALGRDPADAVGVWVAPATAPSTLAEVRRRAEEAGVADRLRVLPFPLEHAGPCIDAVVDGSGTVRDVDEPAAWAARFVERMRAPVVGS